MADNRYRQIRTSRADDVPATVKRVFSYIGKHYRWQFILAIIFTLVSSLTNIISSYMFTPIINDCIVPNIGLANPDYSGLWRMVIVMIAVYLTGIVASFIFTKLISIVSTGSLNHMRQDLFGVMEKLPIKFFDSRTHGEVMNFIPMILIPSDQ